MGTLFPPFHCLPADGQNFQRMLCRTYFNSEIHKFFVFKGAVCNSRADAVIDFFATYTTAVTHSAFQWAVKPPKLPLPPGELDPI